MKKVLLLVFSLILGCNVFADEIEIPTSLIPKGEKLPGNRDLVQFPTVTYEDDNVFIYAPYYIESMEVVIYDASGQSIYTYTSAMASGKNTIVLPTAVSEEKYAIELNYGDVCLVGYF